ncbi:MAG: hypothetical protein ACYTEZ_11895 [Planctomycetota bacterium]|jgi:hypothetical protein
MARPWGPALLLAGALGCVSAGTYESRVTALPDDVKVTLGPVVFDDESWEATDPEARRQLESAWVGEIRRAFAEEAERLGIHGDGLTAALRIVDCNPGHPSLTWWVGSHDREVGIEARVSLPGYGTFRVAAEQRGGLGRRFEKVLKKLGRKTARHLAGLIAREATDLN